MEGIRKFCYFLTVCCLCATAQQPQQSVQDAVTPQNMAAFEAERAKLYQWPNWQFMLGRWQIHAATNGVGFTVQQQLDGKVLTITNTQRLFAAPATKAANNYKSLTVVYIEGLTSRATFFDNEGKSFTYTVDSSNPNKISFVQPATRTASGSSITFAQKESTLVIEAATQPVVGAKAVLKVAPNTFVAEKVK